jgi:hypothetical protein
MTPERYERSVEFLKEKRIEEERRIEEARIEAERRAEEARMAREKEEAERRAREEEARLAREMAERFWEENKDNPDYKFPLRGRYPKSVKVYRDFHTGCSLEWATNYIARCMTPDAAPVDGWGVFLKMAKCMESQWTEMPLPQSWTGMQTETSLFVFNPTNIVFSDDGRVVALTFGELPVEGGDAVSVLVGGELLFSDGTIPAESLAAKYRDEIPRVSLDSVEEPVSDFGVSGTVRCFRLASNAVKVKIFDVFSAKHREERTKSATAQVIENAGNADVDPFNPLDVVAAGAAIDLIMALDVLDSVDRDKRQRENLTWWTGYRGKPVVSIVDLPLFRAMANARQEEERKAAEKRREDDEKAEKARNEELQRRLETF